MDNKKLLMIPALALGAVLGVRVATARVRSQFFQNWDSGVESSPFEQSFEEGLLSLVVDGKDSIVTFDEFPYYLSEQTRALLTNAAFLHLKQLQFSKFTRNLSPASQTVLLTGPSETYHQMLAKALAHFFEAKLLIFDVTDFSLKMQSKPGNSKGSEDSVFPSILTMANGLVQRIFGLLNSNDKGQTVPNGSATAMSFSSRESCEQLSGKAMMEPRGSSITRTKSWPFEDKMLVIALYRVLTKLSKENPIVLHLRNVENLVLSSRKTFSLFKTMIRKLRGPVFILGSGISERSEKEELVSTCGDLASLFPHHIDIKPPEDNAKLVSWRSQLEEDMKAICIQDNRNHTSEVLAANDVECEDLDSIHFPDQLLPSNLVEEIVVSAISHYLMKTDTPQYRNGRLTIPSESLMHGLSLFQAVQLDIKDAKLQCESHPENSKEPDSSTKSEAKIDVPEMKVVTGAVEVSTADAGKKADVDAGAKTDAAKKGDIDTVKKDAEKKADVDAGAKTDAAKKGDIDTVKKGDLSTPAPVKEILPDNEFEKRFRQEMIPAGDIGVSFQDIGALDGVKESLQELIMLPLRRPDLFNRGGLVKPCKGILLFGPPGTGKTMLAKAVATESGASFINVSMSAITSKWFGEDEKNVRALFTLAAKVAPTIIFIDEVDSMLCQRSRTGEHEAMRKIKNEFMARWDGLLSKAGERIFVLAATNRPFDLDDAIIRRFERRIMVGLPDKANREKILRTILHKESVAEDIDFSELTNITEGFSGSDLKNLCKVAAYQPIREFVKEERKKIAERKDEASVATTEKASSSTATTLQANEAEKSQKDKTPEIPLRAVNMEDFRQARKQVSSTFAAAGAGMAELRQWNELYGEGGSRKKPHLTYFL